jgi:plastocyanin
MTKTSYIVLALVIVVLATAGFVVNQKKSSVLTDSTQTKETLGTEETDTSTPVETTTQATDTVMKTEETESPVVTDNPNGIHIMPDGSVMAKDGTMVAGAVIRADGKVVLSDGAVITPAFDMRSDSAIKEVAPVPIVYEVIGTDYDYDIKQIKVKKGDTVTINFKSEGGFHDWVVDELDVATERVNEGEGSTSVTFVADKVGVFQYYCSVMNHRAEGMIGYITVTE